MKPELASKPEEVVEILRRNFTHEQLTQTVAPMLSAANRTLFPEQLEVATQKKVTKVEQMVALLKDSYTQVELDTWIIPKILVEVDVDGNEADASVSAIAGSGPIDPEPL